jgi:hypothetical protein
MGGTFADLLRLLCDAFGGGDLSFSQCLWILFFHGHESGQTFNGHTNGTRKMLKR